MFKEKLPPPPLSCGPTLSPAPTPGIIRRLVKCQQLLNIFNYLPEEEAVTFDLKKINLNSLYSIMFSAKIC